MAALILFGLFFLLLLLRVPIAISLAASSIITIVSTYGFSSMELVADIMYTSVAKFTLLSIPFFIIAGVIMEYAGISKRLIHFADVCVGHKKSGIILVTVLTAIFFAAISGSGPATVAAIGGILIPALVKNGFKQESAAALLSSSGSIGIIIPPSIALIVFGVVAGDVINVSIGRLFIAGIVPGLLLGVAFILAAMYVRKKDIKERKDTLSNMPNAAIELSATREKASPKEMWKAFYDAIWGLLIPFIILGGIYGGVFTPTEAAVVAVFYGLIIGVFVYKELKIKDIKKIIIDSSAQTAVVMFIVSSASVFAYLITTEQIAQQISDGLLGFTSNKYVILLLVNIILLIAGAFMDAISAYYIFIPILLPIMLVLGVDPTVFGLFMTVNLAIGLFTPPVGVNLYVACGLANVSINKISRAIIPFVVASIVVLLLITYVPSISTFLPNLLGVK
ncbi:TRAP transporter large permease [Bacillus sp. 31A1R]|uniref:TRAP transporter large permease n=1 Tax=Robertmurraya mangrovi TaxID=3098077 RepID=A0ABU5IW35_9BACI|nr:TRAP transporter large permease [Bacillus sp. 31A1R]MDZ5471352.1 TRAP transporter large permease [Bacillus sp. 31A1R]